MIRNRICYVRISHRAAHAIIAHHHNWPKPTKTGKGLRIRKKNPGFRLPKHVYLISSLIHKSYILRDFDALSGVGQAGQPALHFRALFVLPDGAKAILRCRGEHEPRLHCCKCKIMATESACGKAIFSLVYLQILATIEWAPIPHRFHAAVKRHLQDGRGQPNGNGIGWANLICDGGFLT